MQLQKGDILIALKAINLSPGIGNRDRAVAAALLDHFNRKTGQCDPGIKRVAGLLGVSERTVFRSLTRIEADRLFKRVRHGGHLNRNSYEPNWQRFREIEAVWSARMRSRPLAVTDLSPRAGQGCQLAPDTRVTQTCRSNLSKETCLRGLPKEGLGESTFGGTRQSGLPGQRSMDAARTEAERRWFGALHERFAALPVTYAEVINAIDEPLRAAATEAEIQKRGAGLPYLLRKLRIPA